MQYQWAEAENVFLSNRTPYISTLQAVENAVDQRANAKMGDLENGGTVVREGQYAEQTLRPRFFQDSSGGNQLTTDFRQNTGSTGWQTILHSDASDSGVLGKEFVFGVAGFSFLEPTQRITELRIVEGDTTHPVINVEEAKMLNEPALILDIEGQGTGSNATGRGDEVGHFVYDMDTNFTLEANFQTSGDYYVKPIGTARVPQTKAIEQQP